MKLFKRLLAHIPTRLPLGMTEFDKWASSIIDITGPVANESDMRFVLAVSVLHQGETAAYIPKMYFAKRLLKGAANQVVSQVIQDIKQKQKEEQQAAALASAVSPSPVDVTPSVSSTETSKEPQTSAAVTLPNESQTATSP